MISYISGVLCPIYLAQGANLEHSKVFENEILKYINNTRKSHEVVMESHFPNNRLQRKRVLSAGH